MNNFTLLYKAEIRKIVSKKSVWIAMTISLAFVLLVGLTNLSADGHRAYVKQQEELLCELSGKPLDDEFLDAFKKDVEKQIEEYPQIYEKISAYDPGAVYQNAAGGIGKKALYDFLYNVMRDRNKIASVTAAEFYAAMREDIIHDGRELGACEEELNTWLEIYDGAEKPMIYSYALTYLNILDVLFIIGWALVLNLSIALAGVFADEKTYRTDAMILSSKNGRLPVCCAKLGASVTVAVIEALVMLGLCMGVMFFLYGTRGWSASIRNVIPSSPWNITIGTMILIYIALAVLVSIFFAMTNLLLSHITKSSVVTMAAHAAVIFAGLFNIPGKMGMISKLWQLRPTMALYYGSFCNTFRYGKMNNIEATFLVYGILAAVFAVMIIMSYKKSQVESR